MKFIKYLALLVATLAFLAACSTSTNETSNDGTLTVTVNTPEVTVTVAGGDVNQTVTIDATRTWELPAGSYTVTASKPGWTTPTAQTATITAGSTTTVSFSLSELSSINGSVGEISVAAPVDIDGNVYDTNIDTTTEVDDSFKTFVFAAQTEESVCFTATLTNEDGDPLVNAPVQVAVTNQGYDEVSVIPGKCSNSTASTFTEMVTDANGQVFFQLFATETLIADSLAKIVVSAQGSDNVTKLSEFKGDFVNMTHLYYNTTVTLTDAKYASQRLGSDFGVITNIWDEDTDNAHSFYTFARPKQPLGDIEQVPSSTFGGEVVYTMTNVSTDADGDPLVEWGGDCTVSTDGMTCTDDTNGGGAITLTPVAGVDVNDLPIEVSVNATYVFAGIDGYEYELKDYSFTKRWVGSYLTIRKDVANHVLTWSGPDITLQTTSSDAGMDDVFETTYTIYVENGGDESLYNVVVTDRLPAELGLIVGSNNVITSTFEGTTYTGTYDLDNHSVTWSYAQNPELEEFTSGEQLELQFNVFARQKPGYQWFISGTDAERWGRVVPTNAPSVSSTEYQPTTTLWTSGTDYYDFGVVSYTDPYLVTNGAVEDSLTVAAKQEDDPGATTFQWTYEPEEDESDIWVVRPIFTVAKTLLSPSPTDVLDEARFGLEVGIAPLSAHGLINKHPVYDTYTKLAAVYPTEFGGTGDNRDNPYANDVAMADAWEHPELDFNDVGDFVGGPATSAAGTPTADSVTWATVDWFGASQTLEAFVELVIQQDNGVWDNCLFVKADNMNQWTDASRTAVSPTEGEGFPSNDVAIPTGFGTGEAANACAAVLVNQAPDPVLSITPKNEYTAGNEDPEDLVTGVASTFASGSDFVYKVEVANEPNTSMATSVVLTAVVSPGDVIFSGTPKLYRENSSGGFTFVSNGTIGDVGSGTDIQVSFAGTTLNSGYALRAVIPATATGDADASVTYTVSVANATDPNDAVESTTLTQ